MCINMTNNKNRNNNTFCLQLFKYLTVFSLSSVFQLFTFIFHIHSFVWQFTLIFLPGHAKMHAACEPGRQTDSRKVVLACMHECAERAGTGRQTWPEHMFCDQSSFPFARSLSLSLSLSVYFFDICMYICTW